MRYTFPCGIIATANDGDGAAFLGGMLLRELRERRAEQEAAFTRLLNEAPQENGWRLFDCLDYSPEFRDWLHGRIPDGWELWETQDLDQFGVRVMMRKV